MQIESAEIPKLYYVIYEQPLIKNIIHHLHKGAFVKDDNLLHSSRGAAHLLKLCQYNKIAIG